MNDQLLIKYLLQETSQEKSRAIEQWLSENPAHQTRYEQVKFVWDSSKELLQSSEVNAGKAWERFVEKRARHEKHKLKFSLPVWFRAAAAILVFIFAGAMLYSLPQEGRAYFVGVDLKSNNVAVQLPLLDGSKITLNRNSEVTYSQKLFRKERLVTMKHGEAYFEVERNEDRPFKVQIDKISLTVLGTSFHVKKTGDLIEVILDSGSVEVALGEQKIIQEPQERIIIDQKTGAVDKSRQTNLLFRYYVDNKFIAENIPLQELVNVLNLAYGAEITIGSAMLQSMPITTTLNYGSLSENLEVIKQTLDIHVTEIGDRIVLN